MMLWIDNNSGILFLTLVALPTAYLRRVVRCTAAMFPVVTKEVTLWRQ